VTGCQRRIFDILLPKTLLQQGLIVVP